MDAKTSKVLGGCLSLLFWASIFILGTYWLYEDLNIGDNFAIVLDVVIMISSYVQFYRVGNK